MTDVDDMSTESEKAFRSIGEAVADAFAELAREQPIKADRFLQGRERPATVYVHGVGVFKVTLTTLA